MLVTLIVSPLASRIRDRRVRGNLVRTVTAAMRSRGATMVDVHEAGEPGLVRAAAATAVGAGSEMIVVAGGDGTVRDVAGPLARTGIPLGIVPCGTGNLFATAVGIPRDLDQAIGVIRAGSPVPTGSSTASIGSRSPSRVDVPPGRSSSVSAAAPRS